MMIDKTKPEPAMDGAADDRLLTIDELSSKSEVPSRTIRYYTHEGLLPPPALRGRIGLYGSLHLARLELIKKLQKETYLPLSVIKDIVADPQKTEFLDHNLRLKEDVLAALGYDLQPAQFGQKELAKRTGLPLRQIRELEEMRLIGAENASGTAKFDLQDIEIGKMAKKFSDSGFPIRALKLYRKILNQLADEEADMFYREFQMEIDEEPEKVIQIAKEMLAAANHLIFYLHAKLIQRRVETEIFKYPYPETDGPRNDDR